MRTDEIANALGGKCVGDGWIARCPSHKDQRPSLSISNGENGKPLVYCHAGCSQSDVIEALKSRGLWRKCATKFPPNRLNGYKQNKYDRDNEARIKVAMQLWRFAKPATGTLVETYLQARGITMPIPTTLRFCHDLKRPTNGYWPGMVALIQGGVMIQALVFIEHFLPRMGQERLLWNQTA